MKIVVPVESIRERAAKELNADSSGMISRLTSCLSRHVNELALKFPGLDDIPVESVHVLSYIWLNGTSTSADIADAFTEDSGRVDDYIDGLFRHEFVSSSLQGYGLTEKGKQACKEVVFQVVTYKRLIMKGEYDSLNRLYQGMAEAYDEL